MMSFAILLLFGAHADFWLSEAEFSTKYCRTPQKIADQYRTLEEAQMLLAKDPAQTFHLDRIASCMKNIEAMQPLVQPELTFWRTVSLISGPKDLSRLSRFSGSPTPNPTRK